MSVYRSDNFKGRVDLAAAYISGNRKTSRTFDTCFEMYDGRVVAAALYRRALKNPKLAQNMPRYLDMSLVENSAQAFAHVKTKELPQAAKQERERMTLLSHLNNQ